MIKFPSTTAIGRILPKDAFYKSLKLSNDLKDKFVTDVRRITLSNSLTASTLNLEEGKEVKEILVLTIDLKKREFDRRIVENIAHQNPHKLVFLLRFDDEGQLALYHRKLYTSAWLPYDELTLTVNGFTTDAVWQSFLEQIALSESESETQNEGLTVDERIVRQEAVAKLKKEIEKLEKRAKSEVQPKKKLNLYTQLQEKMQKLEEKS